MIAVLLALTSAHAVSYNAIGLCGETLSVEVTDATPGGYFTFMIGSGPGADAIPFGACAGTDTTLNVLTNSRVVRADDTGAFAMEWAMPEEFCGLSVAVLDMSTCGVSNVDVLGDPDLPVPDLFPGDLAILGMNADGDDDFAWVTTVDIPAGLTVYFTDSGVYADGSLRDTEGTAEWFVEADVRAGTVFTASELGLAGSLAIASSGDQVIAYVGERGAPMGYVAALHSDGDGWAADASSSNDSALPPGLEDGFTAIAVTPEADNLLWVGDGRKLTRDELLTYIHDVENWVTDNSDAYDMSAIEDGPVSELGPDVFVFGDLQVIDGADVTCSSVENTDTYTQCNDLLADGLYFPNGITCGPEWSDINSSYSDIAGFCSSLTGSEAMEVYYECDFSQDRATWYDGVWSTAMDNGFTRHVRCYYP